MMATTVSSEQSEAPTLRRTVYDTIIALSDPISNDVLQSKLHLLDVQSWHEVVEERYLGRLCGFPTCSKKVHVELKQKYKINRQSKKVYESSAEELKFCSKECLAKHQYVLTLVESQPLWLTGDRPPMTSSFEWLQDPGLETLKEKKKEVDSEADVITASLISRITSLKIADNEDDADSSGDEEREKEEGEEKESSGPLFQDQSSKIVIDDSTLEGTKITAPSSQAENVLTPPRLSARKLSESSGGKSENPEEKLARLKAKYPVDKTRADKTAHALVSLIEAKPAPRAAAATTLPTKSLNCSNFERVLHEWLSPAALRYLKNGHVEEEEVYGSEDDPPDIPPHLQKPRELTDFEQAVKDFYRGDRVAINAPEDELIQEYSREIVLPPVDCYNVMARRREILMERLHTGWQKLFRSLKLESNWMLGALKEFVCSLNLTADNLDLSPAEWKLASAVFFRLLFERNDQHLSAVFRDGQPSESFVDFLRSINCNQQSFTDLCSRVLEKFAKYDKYVGYAILAIWFILISYLAIWMILLPFADSDSPVAQLFPPQEYALILPGLFCVGAVMILGLYAAVFIFGSECSTNRARLKSE